MSKLISGGTANPFLPALCRAIVSADEIDLAVAFIKVTGLRLLLDDLYTALAPATEVEAGAVGSDIAGDSAVAEARSSYTVKGATPRLRILTSDYLDVTDPEALRLLMLLAERGAEVRVYESAGASFHLKAYLFARKSVGELASGTAFIGSSNISRQALTDGLEWNYRVEYPEDDGFLEARDRFDELFHHPRSKTLTDEWIQAYRARRIPPPQPIAPGSHELEAPPVPTGIQDEALMALLATRDEGYRRGLVVLATGLGKTWLAAFDARQCGASRILFVAHREEILNQAASTFARIRPGSSVGFYRGETRDSTVDILCASIQTLGKTAHLERFARNHFDYIVIDEFHHAAAPTYRRLLNHFEPRFLLGLTATPDRTDQSDILSLCDDNLVFTRDLFAGIEAGLLSPFHYYGILDEFVNYEEIPWRNGRFDPHELSNKLATLARARHVLRKWRELSLDRTLAFCVSIKHADFMAAHFQREGVQTAAVHGASELSRGEALEQLADGRLDVIFSVDLFSEGVDLPTIDTILMLRPTESKILFLQQLGRGLRKAEGKDRLIVLDFIGNHHAFLHKAQALGQAGATYRDLADFARKLESNRLLLPDGCFINYDLALIDFLKALDSSGPINDYQALLDGLGRRPTLTEYYRSGASIPQMRKQHGAWFGLVDEQNDLEPLERQAWYDCKQFLAELETSAMTKSYKMVLLEAFQELEGWSAPPTLQALAHHSLSVLERRRNLLADLPDQLRNTSAVASEKWQQYWRRNPVAAWLGEQSAAARAPFFTLDEDRFRPSFEVHDSCLASFTGLVQELIDYRLARYEERSEPTAQSATSSANDNSPPLGSAPIAYFPDLQIACGTFRAGRADANETRTLSTRHGTLAPERHFIARASGHSMEGGAYSIHDGDYLLMRLEDTDQPTSGAVYAVERRSDNRALEYVLRELRQGSADARPLLHAFNPDYADLVATDDMRFLARLVDRIDPLEFELGHEFLREQIPDLFGVEFNPGNWNSGHVVLAPQNVHILLVTLNKQGKASGHRYLDHWVDERTFHWQTQNQTTPQSKRGKAIIEHQHKGIAIHLFVRPGKLRGKKAAPFTYFGEVDYREHSGSGPMSVIFDVPDAGLARK